MKKLMWLALAISLFTLPSFAQEVPSMSLSGGYSYFRIGGSNGVNLNGFNASASFATNHLLGFVADMGAYHGSPQGVGLTTTTYTFGPRITLRPSSSFVPFAQALFGGAHVSASYGGASGSSNPFAYGGGGGVEIGSGRIGLRPEFDYLALRSNGTSSNCFRIAVGVVFRFGAK
ncbi:MAG TPA: outer membrane beta-barrel protein [Candidatus Acidoferrales bacterium]|nr:outer membrane beta-barrel protein [Candidatus Acidoferrales bacterium]